jgi:hypothetical protein
MPTATRTARKPSTPSPRRPLKLPGQPWRWLAGGAAFLVAAVVIVLAWPKTEADPPRARQYIEFTACLLTGEAGITDATAIPAWDGLQEASLATHAKVQYLAITGPQTIDNGTPFVNTLAQTGCNLIFAAGQVAVASIDNGAHNFPQQDFYPIGGGQPTNNVHPISADDRTALRTAVRDILTAAVAASAHS